MVNMNRLFLCVIIFGLSVGIGLGIVFLFLPSQTQQSIANQYSPGSTYTPDVAADRVSASRALDGCAGVSGRSVTEYVNEAEKVADSINQGAMPKYRGADKVTITYVAQTMATLHSGYTDGIPSPSQLAAKARVFVEQSIPR